MYLVVIPASDNRDPERKVSKKSAWIHELFIKLPDSDSKDQAETKIHEDSCQNLGLP